MVVTKACYIKTRRYKNNRLLSRKQFIVDVYHPGCAPLSKKQIREKLTNQFRINNKKRIVLYGMRNKYGGGKQTCYCHIYDTVAVQKKYEPKYRLIRQGVLKKKEGTTTRKVRKERVNKGRRKRGLEKAKILYPDYFKKLAQKKGAPDEE